MGVHCHVQSVCMLAPWPHASVQSSSTLAMSTRQRSSQSFEASKSATTDLEHNGFGHILDPHVRLSLLAGGMLVVLGLLSIRHKVWVQLLPHCLQLCISHAIAHPVIYTHTHTHRSRQSPLKKRTDDTMPFTLSTGRRLECRCASRIRWLCEPHAHHVMHSVMHVDRRHNPDA